MGLKMKPSEGKPFEKRTFTDDLVPLGHLARSDKLKAPLGKFIVVGVDKFSYEDWLEGTYDTAEQALKVARSKTEREKPLATDHSVATVYYAYDDQDNYLGGDIWVGE